MEDRQEKQDAQRILLIKETILNAEKNIQAAKSLLAQLESKYIPQKKTYGVAEGGKIVEGSFDGQVMMGVDGRQYPVPANYASKSKLVEGDMLKLVITDDGNFIYKQIGPFKRKNLIGILKESAAEGGYVVEAEGRQYKVLLAAVTYHHAQPGDEVALVVADNEEAQWGAIENVTKKGAGNVDLEMKNEKQETRNEKPVFVETSAGKRKKNGKKQEMRRGDKEDNEEEKKVKKVKISAEDIDEELTPDLKGVEEELKKQMGEGG